MVSRITFGDQLNDKVLPSKQRDMIPNSILSLLIRAEEGSVKRDMEKKASELRLTFVEGQSGAGGAHSALVKNGYSKKGLGVTSWDDKVAELNSFGMAGWRKVVYEYKKAATIHKPSRIAKECKYTHPVLGKCLSYSAAIAAAMAACKGQGTLKFTAA